MISENNKIKTKKNTWKKTPTVFQMEVTECGAACLGSILGYYKKYVGLEELRVSCGVSKDGCSADNIVKAAQNYGLDYKAYSYSIEELLEQDEPCIIHWDFKHYVVYEGIKHNKIYINDPDGGRRVVPYDELYGSFTGVALCFKPNENFKTVSRPSSIFDFLIKRSRTHISTLFLLFLFGLVLVVPPVLTSAYTRVFIDWIIYTKNIEWFIMLVFMMLFTILYQIIFSIFRIAIVQKFQLKLSFLSGYEFLDRMLKMPLMFYSQRYAGDLSNRVSLNDEANTFISGNIVNIVLDIFTSIFYLILMFVYNVPLTLISIVCVSVLIYVSARIFLLSNEIAIKYSQDFSKLSGIMIQGAEIFATIKATGSEKNFVKKLIGLYSGMGKNDQQLYRLNAYLGFLPTVIVNIFNIVLLCIGALFATKGVISVGVLAAFMIIFASFVLPVTNMFVIFQQFQKLRANLMRITDIENYQTDPIFKQEKISKNKLDEKLTGPVELKNVSFGYNKTKDPIIKDFSVKVMPGETIALVGPSGSCKSTVLKLISGLYEPWSGEILINNKPIYEYSQGALASSMSSVDQEIVMFSGSVRENITLWNDFVYEDDIFNAAKDACIHDIISGLPGGYNYQLEHGAKNISTGQRQRLEIARALVCNPGILLMDEATSALDPIVEKKIIDNIRRRGCLCVVVAHRLSTIRDADKIICIDNGQIVQVGTHDELKQDEGLYKDLIKNL